MAKFVYVVTKNEYVDWPTFHWDPEWIKEGVIVAVYEKYSDAYLYVINNDNSKTHRLVFSRRKLR